MSDRKHQKLKLLYLLKIFMEETDDTHGLSRQDLIDRLKSYGVSADRKTLYSDLEELRVFGADIITEHQGNDWSYHIGERAFELAELKLLVDSVQSARFITERKSRALIKKLESLVSRHEAKQLHRQVLITGRIKTMNESIYYNVDKIHTAINVDSRIRFLYFQWNVKKEMVLRHNGAWYDISPWGLIWDNENYYMIGYDSASRQTRHYRVDKMLKISPTGEKREGREALSSMNIAGYSRQLFGMFAGEETRVALEAADHMAGILIDRFGQDIHIIPGKNGKFTAYVTVAVSSQFLGWIFSLGNDVRITGPGKIIEMMKQEAQRLLEQYSSFSHSSLPDKKREP